MIPEWFQRFFAAEVAKGFSKFAAEHQANFRLNEKVNFEINSAMNSKMAAALNPLEALAFMHSIKEYKPTHPEDPHSKGGGITLSSDEDRAWERYVQEHNPSFGGHPAELKSLSHLRGTTGCDFMLLVFLAADAAGFFREIPARSGWHVPGFFVAETTPEHIQRNYKDLDFQVLKTLYDRSLGGEVSVVKLSRQGMVDLFTNLFFRTLPGFDDLGQSQYGGLAGILSNEDLKRRAGFLDTEEVENFEFPDVPSEVVDAYMCSRSFKGY